MGNLHDGCYPLMRQAREHAGHAWWRASSGTACSSGLPTKTDPVPAHFQERLRAPHRSRVDHPPPTRRRCTPVPALPRRTQPAHTDTSSTAPPARPGTSAAWPPWCLKLVNIVRPHVALFGKGYQLMIITNMVREFALPIEIIRGETSRADDGLALSSRNGYLTPEQRAEAPRLQRQ